MTARARSALAGLWPFALLPVLVAHAHSAAAAVPHPVPPVDYSSSGRAALSGERLFAVYGASSSSAIAGGVVGEAIEWHHGASALAGNTVRTHGEPSVALGSIDRSGDRRRRQGELNLMTAPLTPDHGRNTRSCVPKSLVQLAWVVGVVFLVGVSVVSWVPCLNSVMFPRACFNRHHQ